MADGPASVPDVQVVARATEWIRRQQHAEIDYAQLADGFPMTQEHAQVAAQIVGPLGEALHVEYIDHRTNDAGITTYRFNVTFASGKVRFDFGLLADGKINQLSFRPLPGESGPFDGLLPNAGARRIESAGS